MSTSGTTPSYPGTRPSGGVDQPRVYKTPEKLERRIDEGGAGRSLATKSNTTLWVFALVVLAIILFLILRR